MIFFAGKSSDDFKLIVSRYPNRVVPEKSFTEQPVPGRNGNLLFLNNSFNNYTQEYECYISAEKRKLDRAVRGIAEWLLAPEGYQELTDTYDIGYFRLAAFNGPLDVENALNRYGRTTLSFNCKPQRFAVSGKDPVDFHAAGVIRNEYAFDALPLIEVYGIGHGTVTIGSTTVTIHQMNGHLTLDSELMDAYDGLLNMNPYISAPEFPVLKPGANAVSFGDGVTNIKIVPRWWTL